MFSRAFIAAMFALFLVPGVARAADSFNGIVLGQTFDTTGWKKASDGSWVKPGELSGVDGYWSVDLCKDKVQDISYLATNIDGRSEVDTISSVFRSGMESAGWRIGEAQSGPSPLGDFFSWHVPFTKGGDVRILSILGSGDDWKISLATDNPSPCR